MDLTTIPSDCFLEILRHIPLQHLIPLRAISTNWKSSIETICRAKTSLVLTQNPNKRSIYQKLTVSTADTESITETKPSRTTGNVLHFGQSKKLEQSWNLLGCRFLLSLFSSLTSLTISCEDSYHILHHCRAVLLSEPWLSTLTSITLYYHPSDGIDTYIWISLSWFVNLKHLELRYFEKGRVPETLPLFGQLEFISFGADYTPSVLAILRQLSPDKIRRIQLIVRIGQLLELRKFFIDHPELTSAVKKLTLIEPFQRPKKEELRLALDTIPSVLTSLEHLHLYDMTMIFEKIFPILSNLTSLPTLQLTGNGYSHSYFRWPASSKSITVGTLQLCSQYQWEKRDTKPVIEAFPGAKVIEFCYGKF